MREVLNDIIKWREEGKRTAVATVVHVHGSALRQLGSKMAVSSSGELSGSVSGGCVEGAVFEEAQKVMQTGVPVLVHYGISDDLAFSVGLACGGEVEIFIEAIPEGRTPFFDALTDSLLQAKLAAAATILAGPGLGKKLFIQPNRSNLGDFGHPEANGYILNAVQDVWKSHKPQRTKFALGEDILDIFIDVFPPPPKLIIIGAVHIAIPLISIARVLGFHTIVIDPRSAFATPERFPHPDLLIKEWPTDALKNLQLDESTYVVTLTHDDKLDNPALQTVLEYPVRYIGALGSKKTHAKRAEALLKLGISEEQIARVHAPVGLDLGGRKPEEIALAIVAEMIAVSNNRLLVQE